MFGSPLAPVGLPTAQPIDRATGPSLQSLGTPQIKKTGGMFGGGLGQYAPAIVAAITGYLAARGNPLALQSAQAMNEQRQRQMQLEAEQQQYQRERADKRDDFTFEQDYKTAHAGPDDFTARIQELEALQPGLGKQYAQTYARNGGGLGLVTNPVTGEQYAQRPASPPAEAVARLKANPAEAAQFDEIFGPGSSAGILGGPTQPASGGFPGR